MSNRCKMLGGGPSDVRSWEGVHQLRIATYLSMFLSSGDFLSSTNFEVHNSEDLNSTCCISKSSIPIHLKNSERVVFKTSMSGLMRYEQLDP